jgi:hypothetical protein
MRLATRQELIALTGRKRPSAVAERLRIMGLHYLDGAADGWPRVLVSAIEKRLDPPGHSRVAEVDIEAMGALQRRA